MRAHIAIVLTASILAPPGSLVAQIQPDAVLYDRALKNIEDAQYVTARVTLNTLVHTYETSGYVVWAKLAIASSWLREGGQRGLTQSEAEYNDFALFYPSADDLRERITVTRNPALTTHARNLIREITPTYPAHLLAQSIEGTVQLVAGVSKEGVPESIKVLNIPEHEEFATAAVDAVRQWRYRPMLANGRPIGVLSTIQVNFRLNGQ